MIYFDKSNKMLIKLIIINYQLFIKYTMFSFLLCSNQFLYVPNNIY